MAVIPVRLGEPPRQLFALLQPAGGASPRQHGVLLCNPFGQEAIRAHRLVRVLADRLAAAGFAVMRFDFHATGDSDGDDVEGDLETWVEDVRQADAALMRLAGVRKRSWFGIRLGASIAALARERTANPPERLILWDPVTDGGAYLDELASAHASALRHGAAGLATSLRLARSASPDVSVRTEALGFPLTDTLRAQIASISLQRLQSVADERTVLIASALRRPSFPAVPADGPAAGLRQLESAIEWAADQQMNSAVVPADALREILASLKGEE